MPALILVLIFMFVSCLETGSTAALKIEGRLIRGFRGRSA
jgi:hypothetical protein